MAIDYPINLKESDNDLRSRAEKLPQMRYLFNDREIFELACQIVMIGIRSGSNGSAEKEKMRNSLKVIVKELMGVESYDALLNECHRLNLLEESQVDQICQNDYYDLKLREEFFY
jgi:hypothetical protein